MFRAIEREAKANFAASTDLTGNPKAGGDWVMESDNVNVRDVYFWYAVDMWQERHFSIRVQVLYRYAKRQVCKKKHAADKCNQHVT